MQQTSASHTRSDCGFGDLRLGQEISHRCRREGFPSESRERLDREAIPTRRRFLQEVADSSKRFCHIRGREITRADIVQFGGLALHYVAALASALDGQCPTIHELLANLAQDPQIGNVNSEAFEKVTRILLSSHFSKNRYGGPLWSGSVENIYHAVVFRFPEGHPRYPGLNIPAALLSLVHDEPQRLFHTAELGVALRFPSAKDPSYAFLHPALQLLTHTGDVTQHPHHAVAELKNRTFAVWSSKKGPWIKPPLLSPQLQILHIAARQDGGFLRDLWSREWRHQRFSHKTVLPAAETLATLNLVRQSTRNEPGCAVQLSHVEVTERSREVVNAWKAVPIGGVLQPETYNPLRRILVTREPLQ